MNCCTYLVEGISISGGDVLLIDAIGDNVAVKEYLKTEQDNLITSNHNWQRFNHSLTREGSCCSTCGQPSYRFQPEKRKMILYFHSFFKDDNG